MDNILSTIKDLYGIEVTATEKITKGFLAENHTLFGTDKKLFLKRYRFDTREKIVEIHAAKQFFADGGIPIILPIVNKKNETFFLFDNAFYAVFPFIDGIHFNKNEVTEKNILSLGEMLARIHLRGRGATVPVVEHFKPWNKEKLIEKADTLLAIINQKDTLDDFDRGAIRNITLRKKLVAENTRTFESFGLVSDHLIHGDYHRDNVFFDIEGNVSHVFDLEKALYAPRMFELFRAIVFLFFTDSFTPENIAKSKLFLQSYLTLYPATHDELVAGLHVFYLRFLHGLWVEGEHYLKQNFRVDQFLALDYNRILYFSEHINDLEKLLLE